MVDDETKLGILTKEELADLLFNNSKEIASISPSSNIVEGERRDFATSYWEQIVRELQKEVQELRNRIERIESQSNDNVHRDIPYPMIKPAELDEALKPSMKLSRTEKHKRSTWF